MTNDESKTILQHVMFSKPFKVHSQKAIVQPRREKMPNASENHWRLAHNIYTYPLRFPVFPFVAYNYRFEETQKYSQSLPT